MKKRFLLFFILPLFASSCTLDGTSWDVDGVGPVTETTLDFSKMIGSENLLVAPDSALTLNFEDTVYRFSLDTLSEIPTITVQNTYLWTFPTTNVPAGTALPTQFFTISLDLNDIQLRKAILEKGFIRLKVKSKIDRKLYFTYTIPKATKNNVPFILTDVIEASGENDTAYFTRLIDVRDYQLDLTGPSNASTNTLQILLDVQMDPAGAAYVFATNSFLFEVSNELYDVQPLYGQGYMGQYAFQSGTGEIDLGIGDLIRAGTVDIDEVYADITLYNFVGADLQMNINGLTATSATTQSTLALMHSSVGSTININRGSETGLFLNPVNPGMHTLHFTPSNSNLDQLIELVPGKLTFDADIALNPQGNISGYNDFYYTKHPALVKAKVVAPLKFSIADALLIDTISNPLYEVSATDNFEGGEIRILAENKFPLQLQLQLYVLDAGGVKTDSLFTDQLVSAAPVNGNNRAVTSVASVLHFPVSEEKFTRLKQGTSLLIVARFGTLPSMQLLQMYSDYFLRLKVIGDIKYKVVL